MLEKRMLGQTDVEVSRIGISSSYGAEQEVYEEAFDRGCSYFTWGTFIKGRSASFKKFIQGVTSAGNRERISIGLLSYSHSRLLGDMFLQSALKQLGVEYVDGLLLGYYSRRPPQRILDWAMEVKEKGLVRAIGITTHNRNIVPNLAAENILDYFHIRYNAAHRGAEQDIFAKTRGANIGLVSFTATCWGKLMEQKKMPGSRGSRLLHDGSKESDNAEAKSAGSGKRPDVGRRAGQDEKDRRSYLWQTLIVTAQTTVFQLVENTYHPAF